MPQDPTASYSFDVLKTIFHVAMESKVVNREIAGADYRMAHATAQVLRDRLPNNDPTLKAEDVCDIYRYVADHPSHEIFKWWANREHCKPENVRLLQEFDEKLIEVLAKWDRSWRGRLRKAVDRKPIRIVI